MTKTILTALIACSGLAHAQVAIGNCSNATLQGDYAFTITGQILTPSASAGPVAGVTWTHFDGAGNLTQIDHVVHNGQTPFEDWRPGNGPYTVNSDCTGTATITAFPTDPRDAGPPLHLYFVVSTDGSQIRTVVSDPPAAVNPAMSFSAAITSIGVRIWPLSGGSSAVPQATNAR
jgi:hypothetical protein